MFALNKTERLEIASKIFGWKKAEMRDVARELDTSEEELLGFSDEEFLDVLMYYSDTIGVCS